MVESEWITRKTRIDSRLKSLSQPWNIIKYSENLDTSQLTEHAVEEFPTANGPADYAFFVNGQLLGILEAKKVSISPQNVLEQAKRYSMGAQKSDSQCCCSQRLYQQWKRSGDAFQKSS
ncbi:MAG: hypothetical protein ACOX2F_03620 [bacterium]